MKAKHVSIYQKFGIALILLGSFDIMEGSILINLGSIVLAVCGWIQQKPWKWWSIVAAILISAGVVSLWTISSYGGFDPKTEWWWLVAILPYPIGWLGTLGALGFSAITHFRKPKQ